MVHGWHWKQREYNIEPGEVLRMKSGTTVEVITMHGPSATIRTLTKGKMDRSGRKVDGVSLIPCCRLERLDKVEGGI